MIDLATYRIRIGSFCLTYKNKTDKSHASQDELALGLALLMTLLLIAGIEPNPGPANGAECEPSFLDNTSESARQGPVTDL